MLVAFVLIHCIVLGYARLYDTQPIVLRYFDDILQVALQKQAQNTYVSTIKRIQRFLLREYAPCKETDAKEIGRQFTAPAVYPGLCGTIGYTDPPSISRKWKIYHLHYYSAIKFSVLYLSLPFFGILCEFSYVRISAPGLHRELCGLKSGLIVYSSKNQIEVDLYQNSKFQLPEGSGFIAVYSAVEQSAVPKKKESHMLWERSIVYKNRYMEYILQKESFYSATIPEDAAYAWHIVAPPYKIIHFSGVISEAYQIYDGPWYKSPILQGKYTSGNLAYIVQTHRYPLLNYTTVPHTKYDDDSQFVVVSSQARNTVYAKRVPNGDFALVVQYLDISYTKSAGQDLTRCHYGGFFVYKATSINHNTKRYSKLIDFCQTRSEKEFTVQLTSSSADTEHYVYVILYSGYSHGQVRAQIQPRKCADIQSRLESGTIFMAFGCNYFMSHIYPDRAFAFKITYPNGYFGPMTVQVRSVNKIYSVSPQGLSMVGDDHNIYNFEEVSVTNVTITGFVEHDFMNARTVGIQYEPQRTFNTLNAILIEIHSKIYEEDETYVDSSTKYSLSHFGLFTHRMNFAEISGLTDYYITAIALVPKYVRLEITYISKECQHTCDTTATVRIKQYITSYNSFHEDIKSIPQLWANTLTQGTFELEISLPEECRHCTLLIRLTPISTFNSPNPTGPDKQILRQHNRSISWNDASRECKAEGKMLLQETLSFIKYESFSLHALEYARRTGNYSTHVLLLQFPKTYKVYTLSYLFGYISRNVDGEGAILKNFVVSMDDKHGNETLAALPYIVPANTSDSEGRCHALVLRYDLMVGIFVRIACNVSIPAMFICEDNIFRTLSPRDVFMTPFTTTYARSIEGENVSTIQPPTTICPYPWLPAEHSCVGFIEAQRPLDMSNDWPDRLCAAHNSSLYYRHMPLLHDEVTNEASGLWENNTINIMYAMSKVEFTLGIDVMVVRDSITGLCQFSNLVITHWGNCSNEELSITFKSLSAMCVTQFAPTYDIAVSDLIKSFQCEYKNFIPVVFHCDGTEQCLSGDDEDLCPAWNKSHKTCSPFSLSAHKDSKCTSWCPSLFVACSDGRCIPMDALCNDHAECADVWDEAICHTETVHLTLIKKEKVNPLSHVHSFLCRDGSLYNAQQMCLYELTESGEMIGCKDSSHLHSCEYSGCPYAYKCWSSYCIPLRRLCDGTVDCVHGDDELACTKHVCTGLLQCRGSNICIPPWEVCDGHVHCKPFQEDEVYCEACPAGLLCHGRAAECCRDYPPVALPALLKALVCTHPSQIRHIFNLTIQAKSLLYLDISNSNLTSEDTSQVFARWLVLVYINVAHNELVFVPNPHHNSYPALKVLVLSFNKLSELQSYDFVAFINLRVLILHHNRISVLRSNSFMGMDNLQAIMDLTHNNLLQVMDIPDTSPMLYWVASDRLYICCLLPSVDVCTPTSSTFSSCTNLLQISFHRILIYGQALLIFATNAAVLVFQKLLIKRERYQFINLSLGNLVMSLYLILIAGVDVYYRNSFHFIAVSWNQSVVCKIAATFNMVGAEVSLTLMVYISLCRAYTIHSINKRFSNLTTWTVCSVIWSVWTSYAVGLSAIMENIDRALDSNICIYVFFHSLSDIISKVHGTVFVVANLVLVAQLFVFYGYIAWKALSVQKAAHRRNTKAKKRRQTLSVRLSVILLFTVLCWLPLMLCQLLSLLGVSLPDAVPVWMAILILPINASFSPIMFVIVPILVNMKTKKPPRC